MELSSLLVDLSLPSSDFTQLEIIDDDRLNLSLKTFLLA